ncbi:MAG: hypothetical protein CMO55_28480 [Verrucomicrobiales bacterium]|nr:hypothetical protein [Verrucomicrobiales bacterium]
MIGRPSRQSGYALLDVVLAVALFAITVTGLVQVLQRVNETSSAFARDRLIQQRIESLLAEKRRLGIQEMTSEFRDERMDVTYRTYVEDWEVENGDGAELANLYRLTVEAAFIDDGGEQLEKADLILYKPEDE